MAGSTSVVRQQMPNPEQTGKDFDRYWYKISWTADAADGSVPDTSLPIIDGWITLVVTDPGATAPTALYDITIEDAFGVDIMGGALVDRSATATEQAMPLIAGSPVPRMVQGVLTIKWANNAVNSAVGDVYVYVQQ